MSKKVEKFLTVFLIVVGVLINDILVILIAASMAMSFAASPATLSPIRNTSDKATMTSTFTSLPTLTATLTTTPTITPSPVPTETPLPTKDPAEFAYLQSNLTNLTILRSSLMDVGELSGQARDDPYILKNKTWKDKFYVALDNMQNASREMSMLKAPVEFEGVQEWLVKLYPEIKLMNEDFRRGIEGFDPHYIGLANEHLTTIMEYVQNATLEMGKVKVQ